MSVVERAIVHHIFESTRLDEAGFDANGKHYVSAFGNYSCDGQKITREEYFKAKEDSGSSSASTHTDKGDSSDSKNKSTPWDSAEKSLESYSNVAGSKLEMGKKGPYYYAGNDPDRFEKSVSDLVGDFKKDCPDMLEAKTSSRQTIYYDKESGKAIVVVNDNSPSSWCQLTTLSKRKMNELDRPEQDEYGLPNNTRKRDKIINNTRDEYFYDGEVRKVLDDVLGKVNGPATLWIKDELKENPEYVKFLSDYFDKVIEDATEKNKPEYASATKLIKDKWNKYLKDNNIESA